MRSIFILLLRGGGVPRRGEVVGEKEVSTMKEIR